MMRYTRGWRPAQGIGFLIVFALGCNPKTPQDSRQKDIPNSSEACSSSTDCSRARFCVSDECRDHHPGINIEILNDPVVHGVLHLEVRLTGDLIAEELELLVDGGSRGIFRSALGSFALDTFSLVDGEHELGVRVANNSEAWTEYGMERFRVENPAVRVTSFAAPERLYPGAEVEIELHLEGQVHNLAADFSSAVPRFSASEVEVVSGDPVRLIYRVPEFFVDQEGWHLVPVRLTGLDGRTFWLKSLKMFLGKGALLPVRARAGRLRPYALPEATAWAECQVTDLRTGKSVVTGDKLEVELGLQGRLENASVLLGVTGYGGHLEIPVSALETVGKRAGTFRTSLQVLEGTLPDEGEFQLEAALQDDTGAVSPVKAGPWVHHVEAKSGALRVSLHWEDVQDLDLHVIEPSGDEIYWESPTSPNTGELDVDGIGDCSHGMDTFDEVVVWELPSPGWYHAKVDFHRKCDKPEDGPISTGIPCRIRFRGCGDDSERSLEIPAGARASGGGANAGFDGLSFRCKGEFVVEGRAAYHHRVCDSSQAGQMVLRTGQMKDVEVRVVDESGYRLNEAEARVKQDGSFQVQFAEPYHGADTRVSLQFIAEDRDVKVMKEFGNVHTYTDPDGWIPLYEGSKKKNVEIPLKNSPPFHLFKMMKLGHERIDAITEPWRGLGVGKLTKTQVHWWEKNTKSEYSSIPDRIYIAATPHPDHFSEFVVLHELGHRIHRKLGRNDSPGGKHYGSAWYSPELAWSEGLATFLAQHFLGSSERCRCQKASSHCYQVDNTSMYLLGNSLNADHRTKLSESVVTAVLWDLEDGQDGDYDLVSGQASSFLKAVFTEMKDNAVLGAGMPDKADLADLLLVIWGCGLGRDKLKKILDHYELYWLQSEESMCDGVDNDCDDQIDEGVIQDVFEPNQTCVQAKEAGTVDTAGLRFEAAVVQAGGDVDVDWYRVHLVEEQVVDPCQYGSEQCYWFKAQLRLPEGADPSSWQLCLLDGPCGPESTLQCGSKTSADGYLELNHALTGICEQDDSRDLYLMVRGSSDCPQYDLNLSFSAASQYICVIFSP